MGEKKTTSMGTQGYNGNKLNERRAKERTSIGQEMNRRTDEPMNDTKTKMVNSEQ